MEATIKVDLAEASLNYEALRLYREEFSVYLQGLRMTEPQFAASTIAMAKIEGMVTRWERIVNELTIEEDDDERAGVQTSGDAG